jgi:chromosome segregation ATPase
LGDLTAEDKTIFNVSNKINLYKNIEDNIGDKRKEYEQKNLETVKQILSLKEQIAQLDKQMEESTNVIANTNTQIIEIKQEVDAIKNTISLLRGKILENRNILL